MNRSSKQIGAFDSSALDVLIGDLGGERLRSGTYKLTSNQFAVDHFVYMSCFGRNKEFVSGSFGARHRQSEAFSVGAMRRHGGDFIFKSLGYDEISSCTMRFDFGRISPQGPHWTLNRTTLSDAELARTIVDFIILHLCPSIERLRSIQGLLSALIDDCEPLPWIISNGAIRAAQIVSLTGFAGGDLTAVGSVLRERIPNIARGFLKNSSLRKDPEKFIDTIIREWREQRVH